MIIKHEPDETVTEENFTSVREYILTAINKGHMQFSGWPLENLLSIPTPPTPENSATTQLANWVERHMLKKTRAIMFSELREVQFEAAKRAAEVILSQETRNSLKNYRDKMFGEGQGSMELAVKHLLDTNQRALPLDAFQLLEAYRQRNGLKSPGDAIRALVDLDEKHHLTPEKENPIGKILHNEIKQLLQNLKTRPNEIANSTLQG